MSFLKFKNYGFSLVELAIVIAIFGLLLSAFLVPLSAQRNNAFQRQTEITLDNAKKALLGFAQTNGRLPCPATNNGTGAFPDDTGNANPNTSGQCLQGVGFLPAATLGIQPTDEQGYAVDGWNNRILYAVTQTNNAGALNSDFTTANAMENLGMTNLQPNLRVCASQAGNTPTRCSAVVPETNFLVNNAVVVLYSLGPTGDLPPGGVDENANLDGNTVFVSHDNTPQPNEFDHIVTWISPYMLYNAMIQAGQLH